MGCQASAGKGQTEFEFFQQLKAYPEVIICCGPVVQIGFVAYTLNEFSKALVAIGCSEDYLDLFDHEVLDSGHLTYFMCAKHWITHAQAVSKISQSQDEDAWADIAYYIFRVTCLTNDWDYKEVINYVSTADKIRRGESD